MLFVNKQQWHHLFEKGMQCGTVPWEMLTKLFVRIYIQQNKLLIYFFSFLWHKIIVLISNLFIYLCEDCNSKFVEIHVDASDIHPSTLVFYTWRRVNITIYRTVYLHTNMTLCLQTLTHIQIKNKLWATVAFLHCCNMIWGLANNNYSLYFLQFLTIPLSVAIYVCAIFSFPTVLYSYIVGPLSKLIETSFFCWRMHKYELLQFVWYWITTQ